MMGRGVDDTAVGGIDAGGGGFCEQGDGIRVL